MSIWSRKILPTKNLMVTCWKHALQLLLLQQKTSSAFAHVEAMIMLSRSMWSSFCQQLHSDAKNLELSVTTDTSRLAKVSELLCLVLTSSVCPGNFHNFSYLFQHVFDVLNKLLACFTHLTQRVNINRPWEITYECNEIYDYRLPANKGTSIGPQKLL